MTINTQLAPNAHERIADPPRQPRRSSGRYRKLWVTKAQEKIILDFASGRGCTSVEDVRALLRYLFG